MDEYVEQLDDLDILTEFQAVGQSIDSFVRVNYETAKGLLTNTKVTQADLTHYKGTILDIIRNNPPLASVPRYFRDGREDYLWYSDFYDDISKDVYARYKVFIKPVREITPANYAEELAKIDLPYFKELVNLISLEHLCMDYEEKVSKPKDELIPEELPGEEILAVVEPEPTSKPKPKPQRLLGKRSYQPKLNNEQYALLAECVETIRLFRCRISVAQLKKLLKGKLPEPLQVTNQKSLVYLLDLLKENKYIKETWMSVAEGNKDFISFRSEGNERRYGSEPHFITMQQFLNNRIRNIREAIIGLENIEEMIDLMRE